MGMKRLAGNGYKSFTTSVGRNGYSRKPFSRNRFAAQVAFSPWSGGFGSSR
jgi:hypothetical protein